MKESKSCHTCQKLYYNLMSANCGHKICFHCVKINRNTTKCSQCQSQQNFRTRTPVLSPSRKGSNENKERSTKVKESQSKIISQASPILAPSRKNNHRSSVGWPEEEYEVNSLPVIKCKDHQQPLTMYCKSTRELICSICVCNRAKLNHDVVPLRMAEENMKKQTKLHRQQARNFLHSIQNAQKTIQKNTEIFQSSYQNNLKTVEQTFNQMREEIELLQQNLRSQLNTFFQSKFKECDEISHDLNYLNTILREYRQNNHVEHCTFSELVYMFTSFKVIKGTIKGLNLDYVPYQKDTSLVQISKYHYYDSIKDYVKLKLDLPLKFGQKKKQKSHSNRSVSKSKYEEWEDVRKAGGGGGDRSKDKAGRPERESVSRKHQMSLCCNVHGIQMGPEQKNLYKMLLKSKFKL